MDIIWSFGYTSILGKPRNTPSEWIRYLENPKLIFQHSRFSQTADTRRGSRWIQRQSRTTRHSILVRKTLWFLIKIYFSVSMFNAWWEPPRFETLSRNKHGSEGLAFSRYLKNQNQIYTFELLFSGAFPCCLFAECGHPQVCFQGL